MAKKGKKSNEKGVKRFALQEVHFMDNIAYKNEFNRQKYDRIGLMIPKGQGEVWKAEAKRRGISLNAFVMQAVAEYMKKPTE